MSSSSVALKSIAKIKGGKRLPKGSSLQTHKNSHPYLRIVDMGAKNISKLNLQYVPDEVFPKISRYITNTDDVLLSIVGTIGLVSIVDEELDNASLTENCVKVTLTDKNFSPEFLYYYLSSDVGQHEIKIRQVGSTQPKLPLYNIEQIPVPALPHEKQIFIAKILGDLDRKIELNRRMNETLEQIGQALFKHHFIDNPERESWNEVSLSDIIEYVKEPITSNKVPSDNIYLPIEKLSMKSFSIVGPAPLDDAKSSLVAFRKNDVLLGAMRVYFHRVNIAPADGITRSTVFVLRTKDIKNQSFVCYLLNQESTIEHAKMTSKGSTMPYAVWTNGLADMKFRLPPENLIAEFDEVAKPILENIRDSYKKNAALTQVRDTLLPELMSGHITL